MSETPEQRARRLAPLLNDLQNGLYAAARQCIETASFLSDLMADTHNPEIDALGRDLTGIHDQLLVAQLALVGIVSKQIASGPREEGETDG